MMPTEQEAQDDSLQESLERAYDAAAAEPGDTPAEPAASTPEPATNSEDGAEPKTAAERARDEKGRFAAKAAEEAAAKGKPAAPPAPVAKPAATETPAPPAPVTPALRPPQAWRPAAREKWASLPPELQQEIVRTSQAAQARIAQAAQAEKMAAGYQQVLAPYQHLIAADGADPTRTTAGLFQMYATLRHGSMPDRANLLARLIRESGTDLEALNSVLMGQPAPTGSQGQPQEFKDPRFDTFMAQLQQMQQAQQQAVASAGAAEVAKFTETHEFADQQEIRDAMLLVMQLGEKRGVEVSLEDAYNQAVKLNPETAAALAQREAAKAAGNANASTQRVRDAASSVKGKPAGVSQPAKGRTLDEELHAVADSMGW